MLSGNESISHYSKGNVAIWMSLAFQAGALNIGGFMACHRFVSHVTGFGTYFGLEVNQPGTGHPLRMLQVPIFFLLGSMMSGFLVDLRLRLHKKPRYYITFGIIFLLVLTVFIGGMTGYFGSFGEPLAQTRDYTLLILLCLTCGIQNGTVTTVSNAVVRTTHLTGITTDLGLGLVRVINREKLRGEISKDEGRANLMRMGLIVCFASGSATGGFLFFRLGFAGFLIPLLTSGVLFGMMLYFQVWKKPRRGRGATSSPARRPAECLEHDLSAR